MTDTRIVLITGATGKQGGAVARHLAGKGFKIRAMTRKVDSDAAKSLAAAGAEIVKGDLDDAASIEAALTGARGAFAVQNTWEAGVEGEEAQGKRFAAVARKVGVQHFVYSSVGSAHRQTGVPHFENKWRIEQTVRGLGFPSWVIIRPVFFMENLTSPWFLNGDKLCAAMNPSTVHARVVQLPVDRLHPEAGAAPAELHGRASVEHPGRGVVPVRGLEQQALLRRHPLAHRVPGREELETVSRPVVPGKSRPME